METLLLIGGLYLAYKMFSKKNTQDKNKDNKGGSDEDDWQKYLEENGYVDNPAAPAAQESNQPTFEPVVLVELMYKKNGNGTYTLVYSYSDGSVKTVTAHNIQQVMASVNNAKSLGAKTGEFKL